MLKWQACSVCIKLARIAKVNHITSRLLSNTHNADREFRVSYLKGAFDGVAVFHMNRPHRKNALGSNMVEEFVECLEAVKYNNNIRTLILRSDVPGILCAGADLKHMKKNTDNPSGRMKKRNFSLSCEELANIPVPTIAALDGHAIGGGMELALACDMIIGATGITMGLTETTLALIPGAGGTQKLARLVGPSIAKDLISTGRKITPDIAHELGILNYVVEQNETGDAAYQRTLSLAKEIIPNGPVALRMAKSAINRGLEVPISDGLAFEELCYMQIMSTKDRIEALDAFKEKRKPIYKGE